MIQLALGVVILATGLYALGSSGCEAWRSGVFSRRDATLLAIGLSCLCAFWSICHVFEFDATPPVVDQLAHDELGCRPTSRAIGLIKLVTPLGDWKNHLLVLALLLFCSTPGRTRRKLTILALAFIGAGLTTWALKTPLGRQRPTDSIAGHADLSYPSGHAACSLVFFLGLSCLVDDDPRARRFPTRALTLGIAVLVGYSRLYLRAHWLTDVVGAWCLGAFWLSVAGMATGVADRSGPLASLGVDTPAGRPA